MRLAALAVAMSVIIIIASLPMGTFASMVDFGGGSDSSDGNFTSYVYELEDRREEYSKHFHNPDGTIVAVRYDMPVHRHNENGEWIEIDNTLSSSANEYTTPDARIKFAKKITGNEVIFTLHDGNGKITFSLDGANKKVNGEITNYEADEGADDITKLAHLNKLNSSIIYKGIQENVDLEYIAVSNSIKENIIVHSPRLSYEFSFTMKLNNLIAEMTENGNILVMREDGDVVYNIAAPYMYDANGKISDQVYCALTKSGSKEYKVTVTADSEWMNSPERAFPITIDPPIYSNSSAVIDLDLSTSSPDRSSPGDTSIYVSSTWRAYWKLSSLPTLPGSAYITDADFTMTCFTSSAMSGYVAVYDVLTDWDSTLTWNKVIASADPSGKPADSFDDFQEIRYETNYGLNNPNGYHWNVTQIVKKWYNGENYGMMFAPASNTTFTGTAQFRSNDFTTVSVRPQLTITYVDMKGLEDYWSFTSQDVGFAGTGYINNATGNLVFVIPTLTTTDALMPIMPSLVYNFCLDFAEYKYPNVQSANTASTSPRSTKLNLNETLIKKAFTDVSGSTVYYFIWADGDGTEHYFIPTGESNTYADEEGLLLTLKESTSSCTVTDSNKTVRTFTKRTAPSGVTSAWYLSSIADKNGNQTIFTVDSSYRPTAISLKPNGLSAIEQLRISYNDANSPYAVWNPASGEGVVFRYSNTYNGSIGTSYGAFLKKTIRAHGGTTEAQWLAFYNTNDTVSTSTVTVDAVAEYSYNYLGLISKVTNTLSQYKLSYSTYSSKKISAYREISTVENENGQKVKFTYGTSSTTIQSSGGDDIYGNTDDLITTCCFDNSGRTVSSYTTDLNNNQILGASFAQYVGNDNQNARNSIKSSIQTTQQSSNYLLNGGFEYASGSTVQYWSKTGTVGCNTVMAYEGGSAAELTLSNSVSASSLYQYVNLDKGDYSLSVYLNTHEIADGVSLYLKAESTSDSSHTVIQEIPVNEYYATGSYTFACLNFSADPAVEGGKEQFKISFVISGNVSSTEEVWIDNIMLSRTTGVSEFDMSSMGHFESNSGSYTPDDFWSILDYPDKSVTIVDSGIPAFGDVLHIDINLDEYEFVQQVMYRATDKMKQEYLPSSTATPDLFTISGWGKGTHQSYSPTSLFGLRVKVKYYNGSDNPETETYDFSFDKGISDWQFVSGGFASNPDKGMIDTITVMIMYNDHAGDGYFDSISLTKDSYNSEFYDYYPSGYLSTYSNSKAKTWYCYDDNNNLISAVSTDKSVVLYTYDSQNRVKREYHGRYQGVFPPSAAITVNDISGKYYNSYNYNSYGQLYAAWTYDMSDESHQSYSVTEYNTQSGSHIFGTVANKIDALGNITRYFYNQNNGRLLAEIAPDGNGVCYQYDGMGNLTEVLRAEINSTQNGYTAVTGGNVSYSYDSATKRLSTITTHPTSASSTTYTFSYDNFGKTSSVSVGSRTLASYSYNSENGKINTLTYGNGLTVKYVYDSLDRISEIKYNRSDGTYATVYSYKYDTSGNLFSVTDHYYNKVTLYNYDSTGKLMSSYVYDAGTHLNEYGTIVYYDEQSRVNTVFHSFDYPSTSGVKYDQTHYFYAYGADGNIETIRIGGSDISGTINPTYDNFGRKTSKTVDFNINNTDAYYNKLTYDYKTHTSGSQVNESLLVSQIVSEIRKGSDSGVISTTEYHYTYDANGNITQITDAGGVIQNQYTYDSLGQLTREDNRALNKTYVWMYDNAGNILTKKTYAFTTGTLGTVESTITYSYGDSTWKDLLTSYNGTAITYDGIGNPDHIGNKHLIWKGRLLNALVNPDQYSVLYGYNADNIRTYKQYYNMISDVTTTHRYTLSGSQIIKETVYNGSTELYTLVYLYDENGAPIGYRYRTPSYASGVFDGYFFEKNLQGDIVAVYNQNGVKVAGYIYDAWGNCTTAYSNGGASTAAQYNPFRYRGYYYDTETGLYYLNSRYYDPVVGRFLNADGYISTGQGLLGFNMFAYCGNNPTNYMDPSGCIFIADDMVVWGFTALSIAALLIVSDNTISLSFAENSPIYINPIPTGLLDNLRDVGTVAIMEPSALCVPTPCIEYVSTLDTVTTITYEASHRKRNGSKKKTNDKHTNKRSGSTKDKAKNKAGWEYRGNKKHGPIDYTPIIIYDLQLVLNNNSDRDEMIIWKPIF